MNQHADEKWGVHADSQSDLHHSIHKATTHLHKGEMTFLCQQKTAGCLSLYICMQYFLLAANAWELQEFEDLAQMRIDFV